MDAARLGLQTGFASYRDDGLSIESPLFESYAARMGRYYVNLMYRGNTQYSPTNRLKYSIRFNGRYRHMRGIYNSVARLIDLEVNKTYGGNIGWTDDLRTGAIPIQLDKKASPFLIDSIKQLLEWSNFGDGKDLYVRNGSTLGDSFLKVTTLNDEDQLIPTARKVLIEVLDPHKVYDVEHDRVGNVKAIIIQFEDTDEEGDFVYREEIDKKEVRIFRDKEQVDSYPNTYGFVPVVHVRHKHVGKKWGITSFHNSLEKIDELNDGASVTKDGLRKANNPMLLVKGGRLGQPNEELLKRDGLMVFELPKPDMNVEPITPVTDVMGSIANMDKESSEIEADMPMQALQRIRDKSGDMSGVAIENSYSDASDAAEAIQGNYDERLIRALQMGCTMAGILKLEGFPYNAESYAKGELRFYIKERKVFSDRLSKEVRARLLIEAADSDVFPIIARDLEVSEEDIEMIMASRATRQAEQIAAGVRAAAQAAGMDMNEEDDPADNSDPTAEVEGA